MKRSLHRKVSINLKLYRKLQWMTLACIRQYVYDKHATEPLDDDAVTKMQKSIEENLEGFLYWWKTEKNIYPTDFK